MAEEVALKWLKEGFMRVVIPFSVTGFWGMA